MKINAKRVAPDVYSLKFDDTEIALDTQQLKMLLLQVTKQLAPDRYKAVRDPQERAKEFLKQLRGANAPGLQALLCRIDHDDALILLKTTEGDEALQKQLWANMSDNARTVFKEDLAFRYKDGAPPEKIRPALDRVMKSAREIKAEGILTYRTR